MTVEVYNALIGALGRCGLLEDAEALLERMQWAGVEPNTVTYAVHAHALCKAGEWQRASDAMAAMEAKGLPLDVRLYTSLVYGSAKAGEWDAADAAMEAMEMAGFTPDVHTYTALIGQLAKGASRFAHTSKTSQRPSGGLAAVPAVSRWVRVAHARDGEQGVAFSWSHPPLTGAPTQALAGTQAAWIGAGWLTLEG